MSSYGDRSTAGVRPGEDSEAQHNSPAQLSSGTEAKRADRADHYKALYATVMENRPQMEKFLKRYNVKW